MFDKYKINFKDIDYVLSGIIKSIKPDYQIVKKFERKLRFVLNGNKPKKI